MPALFRVAETIEEKEILFRLRTEVYREAGKHSSENLMLDVFDSRAILIGAWIGDKAVGSARLIPMANEAEAEVDRFCDVSSQIDRSQTVEVSRVCILKNHRGPEIFFGLLRKSALEALRMKRSHLLACATIKLLPRYQKFCAGRVFGKAFVHSDLGPTLHHLFVISARSGIERADVSLPFFYWASLWAPVAATAYWRSYLGPGLKPVRRLWKCSQLIALSLVFGPFFLAGLKLKRFLRHSASLSGKATERFTGVVQL